MSIGPEPIPSRPVPTKPDPDCGRNPKPTPDPDCVRLVGIGIGRYRLVGIGRISLLLIGIIPSRPVPSRPDSRVRRNSKPTPDPFASRDRNRAGGLVGIGPGIGRRAVLLSPSIKWYL